jgi:8-oxo-dGTP pyrophosphatase MutT (NUDIX family)
MIHVNAAAAVVYQKYDTQDNVRILLIQRSREDHWPLFYEFPRGKCDKEPNEDLIKCVKREVKEETGLDIDVEELLGKYEYLADKGNRHTTCHVYKARMTNDKQQVKLSNEHQRYMWIMEAGEAVNILLPDQVPFAKKVLNPERQVQNTKKQYDNKLAEHLLRVQR